MNHTLALVAALVVAVASPAASSAEELRTLELAPPDPTAWTLPPGWSIEPLAETGPDGQRLARLTMPQAGGTCWAHVNLPNGAREVTWFVRQSEIHPNRFGMQFQDDHGWGRQADLGWGATGESLMRTTAPGASLDDWTGLIKHYRSEPRAPYRLRGLCFEGRRENEPEGPRSIVVGAVNATYAPDDVRWLYVDAQPKTLGWRVGGAVEPVTLRVANLGTVARTLRLSARPSSRNLGAPGVGEQALGELTLKPGESTTLPAQLALPLMGRWRIDFVASAGDATATCEDVLSVVAAEARSPGWKAWTAKRRWFEGSARRLGADNAIAISTGDNGISAVPTFPLLRAAPIAPLDPQALSSTRFTQLSTQLSPAWLITSQEPGLSLFGDLARAGLSAPTRLAFATATGVRVLKRGEAIDAAALAAMSEPWLLAWWQGGEGWTQFDSPHLVVLQRHPAALTFDDAGVALTFAGAAGHVMVGPLYGYAKLPQRATSESVRLPADWPRAEAETWTWDAAFPDAVRERCRWWSGYARSFPCDVSETYVVDHARGEVRVTDAFRYVTSTDDWKTAPIVTAPLSPRLALAQDAGFPLVVDGAMIDPRCPTLYGPYRVAPGDAITYAYRLGAYWMQTWEQDARPPADESTDARRAQARLHAWPVADIGAYERHFDYVDGNFLWDIQGLMRDSKYIATTPATLQDDRKALQQNRALYQLLDPQRYADSDVGVIRRHIFGPGIGHGDSYKLATDMIYDAWVYAYHTGDYQTVADRWDLLTSLNSLPNEMTWLTVGRMTIGEMGDEAPPALGLARLAYAIGDRDVYAAGVYWFARELVHHLIKDGGYNRFRTQFEPWHPISAALSSPFETATNVYGVNAGWAGGGLGSAFQGDNQWGAFYVRLDDVDTIRFHREHATALPRKVLDRFRETDQTGTRYGWENFNTYFAQTILFDEPFAAARADWDRRIRLRADGQPEHHRPATWLYDAFEAKAEFPFALVDLIGADEPAVGDDHGIAAEAMNFQWVGMVDQPHAPGGTFPTPRWYWWRSPAADPGVDWGERWPFGTIAPTGQSPAGPPTAAILGAGVTYLNAYAIRPAAPLDLLPTALRVYATDAVAAKRTTAEMEAIVAAATRQARVPVLLCGPFINPCPNDEIDNSLAHGPELAYAQGIRLDQRFACDDVATATRDWGWNPPAGTMVGWRSATLGNGLIDFKSAWPEALGKGDMAAYVALWVRAPTARAARLGIGSDDGVKVWVNGAVVHDNPVKRGTTFDQDKPACELRAGWNAILVKVVDRAHGYDLALRVADADLLPMPDVEFSATPP